MPRPRLLPLVLVTLVALAGSGCPNRPPAGPADGGATAATPGDCEARRAEIRGLIAAAPRACVTNADCSMYPGGPVDCGGVVDRAAAARIWQLTDAFRAGQCRYAVHCAPRAVTAGCHDGSCVEEQLGGRRP